MGWSYRQNSTDHVTTKPRPQSAIAEANIQNGVHRLLSVSCGVCHVVGYCRLLSGLASAYYDATMDTQ